MSVPEAATSPPPSTPPTPRQSWLRRAIDYVWDNPTAEQDARGILSSPKVGGWLGLLVLLIIVDAGLALFVFPEEERAIRQLMVEGGVGTYLIDGVLGVITLFLTLVVPLRASGLLEGPRWRGYLDQLVTTGMTPMRYMAGKWASTQLFVLALLGVSVPFVVLFGMLGGGIGLGRTLTSYVLLWGYANVLLAASVGLGIVLHEVLALLATWVVFGFANGLAVMPCPTVLAGWSPARYIVEPTMTTLAGSAAPIMGWLYGDAHLFGLTVPLPLWTALLWSGALAVVAITCLIGPLHGFVPGLNNFGTVVLPGDGARAFFRRMRPFIARRVELAFLFENRGPRLVRWTLPLRALQQLLLFLLGAAPLVAIAFDPKVVANMRPLEELLVLDQVLCGLALVYLLFLLRTNRIDATMRWSVGPFHVPLLGLDVGVFFVAAAALLGLHTLGLSSAWADLGLISSTPWRPSSGLDSPIDFAATSTAILGVQLAMALGGLLIMKVVGTRVLSEELAFIAALLFLGALIALPGVAVGVASVVGRADDQLVKPFAGPVFFLGLISPATHIAVLLEGAPSYLGPRVVASPLIGNGFWLWYGGLLLLTAPLCWASHRSLWRENALIEAMSEPGATPPPSTDPPCARCGGSLAVPAGWTSWGGVVLTSLLGIMRCVECQAEFPRRTGRPSVLLALAATAARGLTALGIVGLIGMALLSVLGRRR